MRAIGMMSGTSMDGIDIACMLTDGEAHIERLGGREFAYSPPQRKLLEEAVERARDGAPVDRTDFAELAALLADWHAQALAGFLRDAQIDDSIDVVGFHGHTVLHRPERRETLQIGDGARLSSAVGAKVVHDFRSADVAAGGQGAPLAPIYHAALGATLSEDHPVAFLNLGGVANLTYLRRGHDPIAFDTGPANMLVDQWLQRGAGIPFDDGGRIASEGGIDLHWIAKQLEHPFFELTGTRSLDRFDFELPPEGAFELADGARTLTRFTAEAVAHAARHLPDPPAHWIVCGGGRLNGLLMSDLADCLDGIVEPSEAHGWDGGSMEAEAFAYLAVRSLRGLPLSWPTTTGVPEPMSGGVVEWP